MPKLLGGIFAFVALAVCIVSGIEPWTATVRGVVAFVVGHLAGALWEGFFGAPGAKLIDASALVEAVQSTPTNESEPESDANAA